MKKRGFYKHYYKRIQQLAQEDLQIRKKLEQTRWVEKLLDKLDKEEKTFQMTHGDLHGDNIIISNNKVIFLDLVRAGFASYVKDLVRLDVWERRQWGTRKIYNEYTKGLKDRSFEEKLKLFYLGEFVRRKQVRWIKEGLMELLRKGDLP